jgi:hypothetical protein
MDIQSLIAKIQSLINYRSMGVSDDETKDTYQIIHFRDSFRHKYNAVFFHFNMIKKIKIEIKDIIEKEIHGNKDFLIGSDKMPEKIAFQRQIQFKYTVLLEDIIYHLTSIIDNLPKIISVYYKTVKPEMKFRSAKKQLNHEHTKELDITKSINNNWDWIEKVKDFRAQIFHHHSKICESFMQASFGKDKDGNQYFNEDIIVNVPIELKEAIGYEEEKIEIETFCKLLIDKSFEFFSDLFDILKKDHDAYVERNKNNAE